MAEVAVTARETTARTVAYAGLSSSYPLGSSPVVLRRSGVSVEPYVVGERALPVPSRSRGVVSVESSVTVAVQLVVGFAVPTAYSVAP